MPIEGEFRDLYRTLELPGENPLKAAHEALDSAVRAAYGMRPEEDPLTFLLALNGELWPIGKRMASLQLALASHLRLMMRTLLSLATASDLI